MTYSVSGPRGESCEIRKIQFGQGKDAKELSPDQIKELQGIVKEALVRQPQSSVGFACKIKLRKGEEKSEISIQGETTRTVKYTSKEYEQVMKLFGQKESADTEITLFLQVVPKATTEPKRGPAAPETPIQAQKKVVKAVGPKTPPPPPGFPGGRKPSKV